LDKKVGETPPISTTTKSRVWWHVPVIPGVAGSIKYEYQGPGHPGQKARGYLQNNQSKKGWMCVLSCRVLIYPKHKALSSNPNTARKKKNPGKKV
jgi:hypothetical protein